MAFRLLPPVLPLLILLLPLGPAAPARGESAEVTQVTDCVRANYPQDSSVQDLELLTRDRVGNERRVDANLIWKRYPNKLARALIRVTRPDDLRDSAVLLIERKSGADLFSYVPDLRKVRRISSHTLSGSLFGSDFTYEDFQILQGMNDSGTTERLPDTELAGGLAYVLVRRADPASGSSYEKVVSYIAHDKCLVLKAEMWETEDFLRKVLTTDPDSVFEQDGTRIPRRVVLEDQKKRSSTKLELRSIDLDAKVRRRDLEVAALEK